MDKRSPEERRGLRVTAFALIAGSVLFLGVAVSMRLLGIGLGPLPVLQYVALAAALVSPMMAGGLRHALSQRFAGEPVSPEAARSAVLLPFAVLEGALFLCALALLLTPSYWPLAAAVVPLGAMLLWFPRD